MRIKKDKILAGVKEVEARILRSLERPSSDNGVNLSVSRDEIE